MFLVFYPEYIQVHNAETDRDKRMHISRVIETEEETEMPVYLCMPRDCWPLACVLLLFVQSLFRLFIWCNLRTNALTSGLVSQLPGWLQVLGFINPFNDSRLNLLSLRRLFRTAEQIHKKVISTALYLNAEAVRISSQGYVRCWSLL